jgi:hypothetical protein
LRKKLLLSSVVLSVLLCFSLVVSVDAASGWSQTYGGTEWDIACSLVAASDGGYAIAGYTGSFGAGASDFWLVKTDAVGNMQWNRTYGGAGQDYAQSLVATTDGGYAIAGWTASFGAGSVDSWLVKTDALGNMQWNKTYGGTEADEAHSLMVTTDGGYALAGYTRSFGAGDYDFWLVKTDALGNIQWNKTYGGTEDEDPFSLVATLDGGYALAGSIVSSGSNGINTLLVKTDALGNMEWNKTYGETGINEPSSLIATSDGGYALAGILNMTDFFGVGNGDFWLVKTDASGNMQWNKTYGGIGEDQAYSVVATSDGGYALAGIWNRTTMHGHGISDFWLVKTDAFGNMQWNKTYGGTVIDEASSLVVASDGGYALAGYTNSFGAGFMDFWLVKTDEYGIVPEYSSLLVPALVLTATAFLIIKAERKRRRAV